MLHLGLDIGGTKMEAALLDHNGAVRFRERRPTYKTDYSGFLHHLVEMVEYIRTEQQSDFTLGIGLPGAIDPDTGLIKNCNCLVLNGENLAKDLASRLEQPVFLANDADLAAPTPLPVNGGTTRCLDGRQRKMARFSTATACMKTALKAIFPALDLADVSMSNREAH